MQIALGMGADVTIFDKSMDRLTYLDDIFYGAPEDIPAEKICPGNRENRAGRVGDLAWTRDLSSCPRLPVNVPTVSFQAVPACF